MNKYTWMIIALVLAIAAGLLIKDTDNQPIIMQAINYVRTPNVVVDEVEVATGDEAEMPTEEVADDTMPTADDTMPTADDTMPTADDTMPTADDTMPTDIVPADEVEAEVEVTN